MRVGDLPALRLRVEELADRDPACAERLLGQIATLESHARGRDEDDLLEFAPIPAATVLAAEAVHGLDAGPFGRGRFRRQQRLDEAA